MYLKFLHKLKQALDVGKGIDDIPLNEHETRYAEYNLDRLLRFGGEKLFCRLLAKQLHIEGYNDLPLNDLQQRIVPAIAALEADDAVRVKLRSAIVDIYSYGSYEACKALSALDPEYVEANRIKLLQEAISNRNPILEALTTSDPDHSKWVASAREGVGNLPASIEYYRDLKKTNPLIFSLFEERSPTALHVLLNVMTPKQKHQFFQLRFKARKHEVRSNEEIFGHFSDRKGNTFVSDPKDSAFALAIAKEYPAELLAPSSDQGQILTHKSMMWLAASAGDEAVYKRVVDAYRNAPDQLVELASSAAHALYAKRYDLARYYLDATPEDKRVSVFSDQYLMENLMFASLTENEHLQHIAGLIPDGKMLTEAESRTTRGGSIRERALFIKLYQIPDSVTVQDLHETFTNKESFYFGQSMFFRPAIEHKRKEVLAKTIEVFPDDFMEYINYRQNIRIFAEPDNKEVILQSVPSNIYADIERILHKHELDAGNMLSMSGHVVEGPNKGHEWLNRVPLMYPRKFVKKELGAEVLPLMELACEFEGTDGTSAETHAYKIGVLFDSIKQADQYFQKFAPRDTNQPVHDTLLFGVPRSDYQQWDIESWRQLAMRDGYGPKIAQLFPLAPQIERAFFKEYPEPNRNKALHNLRQLTAEEIRAYAKKISYKNADKAHELADLCLDNGVEEADFETARKLLAKKDLPEKKTPVIDIDGAQLGIPGYHFKRVEPSHPWCALIGKLVNCCNYIGGETEDMAKGQITSPNCSLYVLTNRDGKPVAKCTGWISKKGNFVFNSWERLSEVYDKYCEPFLLAAGLEAMKQDTNINRVLLGTNRGNANFANVNDPEKPKREGDASPDADEQFEVATREKMKITEAKLAGLIGRFKADQQMSSLRSTAGSAARRA